LYYFKKLLDDKLLTYKVQLIKRHELLQQSLDDYEDLLERTGLLSSIEVKQISLFFFLIFNISMKIEFDIRWIKIKRSRNLSR
jgi:hypothetical protein